MRSVETDPPRSRAPVAVEQLERDAARRGLDVRRPLRKEILQLADEQGAELGGLDGRQHCVFSTRFLAKRASLAGPHTTSAGRPRRRSPRAERIRPLRQDTNRPYPPEIPPDSQAASFALAGPSP